ncbi:sugar ABC transporter permease [Litorilinea aerophila]|uniref:Sugar ABC transporter permease n=1 Tax=Litorilinea aerophila TaxID=1204385 RepID=A0A540VL73_9CHLR|nr:sugar ABC transporter permease [Litorilinea aerophila]MCC9075156.1 sugar ABC transporter permease [Litorilinea aerophila]GIV78156.1 MAG: sugar ABC transporter permease [Litorilinea sp.]
MVTENWLPKHGLGRVVLLAAFAFMAFMIWIPILEMFYWSFFVKEPGIFEFAGLDNYRRLFTNDPIFWKSLSVTFNFALMVVPGVVGLGLLLAVAVNTIRNTMVRGFFTVSFFTAYVVPLVAVALVWRYIYLPGKQGLLNVVLGWFGISPIRWLSTSEWALRSLALLRIWKEAGYAMVLFLAGLQAIPHVYYEAAEVDGANAWRRFWHITVPLLMPTIAFVVVITTLSAFLAFTEVYVMTVESGGNRGGPNYATNLMAFHIFNTAIAYSHEGYGSAMAAIYFLIMVAVGYAQYRFIRATYEY